MNKKKMILTSLASVAVLGAGFVASQPASVRAEGAQPAAEKAPTYDDLLKLLKDFENDAIAAIGKRTDLTDEQKGVKRKEIKEFINKDEILKLVTDGILTVDNVLTELNAAADGASQIGRSVDKPYVGKYENNAWTKDKANSGSNAQDLTDEQKQAINRELDKFANRDDVQKAREALADLDEKAEKVSKKIELAKKALETKNESVLKLKALYDEAVKSLGESNELTRRLAAEYSNNHDEFQALYESTQEQIEELKDYNEQISEGEEALISALQNKISDLDDKIAKAEKNLADSQNGEGVEGYYTSGDKDKLEKLQAEQDELQAELDQLLDEVDGQEPAPAPEAPAEQPKPEKSAEQQAEEDYARRSEEEYNRLTQQQPPKAEKPAEEPTQPAPAPEQPTEPTQPEKPVAPKTGWKQENGMWYFYNTDGSMATGWLQNNGLWYYLNANGSMATGWVKDGDTWYYLEASGAMKASQWFKVSDKWYYVNSNGAMATGWPVDGYKVNANGEWV
ncbi:nucleoside triphosphate hydrolase [Streptococcus pneumoniae]|uniref:nucleoside triphosphate hydrolase n=1 Tax=Streptococcus pneumoniae TaxID=1313 RepID=UPI0005E00D7F|nr:nucleoside triphosphate hydrolase [Streptococcus pneumoniae]CJM32618.1 surface protein PspA [Streptococcus pneumoniae]CJV76206.1 surface protein PspA [Streptococcus pneumoniae]CJY25320.1 surface protein PspA [Streptococcus pneumoniae]